MSFIEQVYNIDETGLNLKHLLGKTFDTCNKSQLQVLKSIKRGSLLYSNVSGTHKFSLLVFSKAQMSRIFKNVNV